MQEKKRRDLVAIQAEAITPTDIDSFYSLVLSAGKITFSLAAGKLGCETKNIEMFVDVLSKHKKVYVSYPVFGEPVIYSPEFLKKVGKLDEDFVESIDIVAGKKAYGISARFEALLMKMVPKPKDKKNAEEDAKGAQDTAPIAPAKDKAKIAAQENTKEKEKGLPLMAKFRAVFSHNTTAEEKVLNESQLKAPPAASQAANAGPVSAQAVSASADKGVSAQKPAGSTPEVALVAPGQERASEPHNNKQALQENSELPDSTEGNDTSSEMKEPYTISDKPAANYPTSPHVQEASKQPSLAPAASPPVLPDSSLPAQAPLENIHSRQPDLMYRKQFSEDTLQKPKEQTPVESALQPQAYDDSLREEDDPRPEGIAASVPVSVPIPSRVKPQVVKAQREKILPTKKPVANIVKGPIVKARTPKAPIIKAPPRNAIKTAKPPFKTPAMIKPSKPGVIKSPPGVIKNSAKRKNFQAITKPKKQVPKRLIVPRKDAAKNPRTKTKINTGTKSIKTKKPLRQEILIGKEFRKKHKPRPYAANSTGQKRQKRPKADTLRYAASKPKMPKKSFSMAGTSKISQPLKRNKKNPPKNTFTKKRMQKTKQQPKKRMQKTKQQPKKRMQKTKQQPKKKPGGYKRGSKHKR